MPVLAPEDFIADIDALAFAEGRARAASVKWIRGPVRIRMMDYSMQVFAEQVVAGKMDIYAAQEQFGEWAQAQVIARIGRGVGPPNSPATVARKGHGVQLVDTEKLLRAISHLVKRETAS